MGDSKCLKNVKVWYVIMLFLLYMVVCFLMPTLINGNIGDFIFWNADSKDEVSDFSGDTIKLLLSNSGQVIDISLSDYLKGVLIGEMPVTFELEALKAQAVVARTYTLYKIKNANTRHVGGALMCDDINCCQAYKTKDYAMASWDDDVEMEKWAKIEKAVCDTSGEVILYSGELINAFFHANSGGKTENVKYLWSKVEIPYLISVPGNEVDLHQDSISFTKAEFKEAIKSLVPNYNENSKIEIKDYTGSGRVNKLIIDGVEIEGTALRSLTNIKSTNFRIEESGDTLTFYTIGYGHGVGMSQEGANQMALNGADYITIIKHYYTGVEVSKVSL